MNAPYPYPIPGNQSGSARPSYVADATRKFPPLRKSAEEVNIATFDFSQLTPAITVASCWVRVRQGGEPQLIVGPPISNPSDGAPNTVTAHVQGGIPGRAYDVELNVRADLGATYSFQWTVNILGDDCACPPVPPPSDYITLVTGDGMIVTNTAPRFFVSALAPISPQVLDRWYDTSTGNISDFVTNGNLSYWVVGGGGGGGGGGGSGPIISLLPIYPDGVTTIFTLTAVDMPVTILASNTLFVSTDGVWQQPVVQYQALDNQINFAEAPSADSVIFMVWFAPPGS
jgi:hypothetical protein